MIGNVTKGKDFRGLLVYLTKPEKSWLIGGNMAGSSVDSLSAEFEAIRQLNLRVQRPVFHASLSLPKDESLSDSKWLDLAESYLEMMGFGESQFVVFRHGNTNHDHIHIVANRVQTVSAGVVSDSWDFVRSQKAVRELELQFNLSRVLRSDLLRRNPSWGEARFTQRTGLVTVKAQLQKKIDALTTKPVSFESLRDKLASQEVETRVREFEDGKGISFRFDGVAVAGSRLGLAYSYPGLVKYRGVYQSTVDSLSDLYSKFQQKCSSRSLALVRDIAQLATEQGMDLDSISGMMLQNNPDFQILSEQNPKMARILLRSAIAKVSTPRQFPPVSPRKNRSL